ncbi:MAG: zinc-dependent alcohol dehydrogenase family protein, partial [Acetobacteraceae bacterium]
MNRSVRIHEFGDANVLRIENVEVGEPANGQVRLRIHAIGINRTEITLRSGRSPAKPPLPTGIGFEAAGVIEALGPDVTGFSAGDRVALVPAYGAAQYALYGEVAIAPARSLVAIPNHVSLTEAAATWAAYGTAWGALVAVGALKAGQTVLIPAASSSVGLAAIQIANRLGARPVALTRTSAKAEDLRRLGASTVVATAEQDVVAEVKTLTGGKGAELVVDPVGGPEFATLAKATAAGGTLVLYGALDIRPTIVPPFEIFARDLTIRGLALTALTRDDAKLAALKQ